MGALDPGYGYFAYQGRPLMDSERFEQSARNLLRLHHAYGVIRALNQANITPCMLKGAGLIETGIADADCRPMLDVDILIQPADTEKAIKAVTEEGCELLQGGELNFRSFVKGIPLEIDLHTEIPYLPQNGYSALWDRAQKIEKQGASFLVMPPSDAFIYVSWHMCVHHGILGGEGIRDLERLVRSNQLDWEWITASICQWGLKTPMFLLACHLRNHAGVPVPETFVQGITPRFPSLAHLAGRLFLHPYQVHEAGHLTQMVFGGSIRTQLKGLKGAFFPSSAFIRRRYSVHHPLMIACYATARPLMLAGKLPRLLWDYVRAWVRKPGLELHR